MKKLSAVLVCFGFGCLSLAARGADWPQYRGPNQDGTSPEKGLVESWDPGTGENVVWSRKDLGSRSTPIVLGNKLYIQGRYKPGTTEEGERVTCVNAETGETIWEQHFNIYLSDVPDTRVAWSNVCGDPETGNVYSLGVCGLFQCFDGATGKVLWAHSMHEEYGLVSTYGGRTHSPVVFEDMVFISGVVTGWGDMARPAHRVFAFDKKTGQLIWLSSTNLNPPDTTYSNPVTTVLGGQAAIVFGSSDGGIWALQARTGKLIWNHPFSLRGINNSVLVHDGKVYAGHSEENVSDANKMGALALLDASGKVQWCNLEMMVGRVSPFIVGQHLYVLDDMAGLWVLDPATGKQVKGNGRRANIKLDKAAFSNLLIADGKIYALTTSGRWYVLQPAPDTPQGVKKLHELHLDVDCNAAPIAANCRLYITTTEAMYCVGSKDKPPAADSPARAREQEAKGDDKVAVVQVVPYLSLLSPGQKQQFKVRLLNAQGQVLSADAAADVQFSVDGPGSVGQSGTFTAAEDNKHYAVTVTAKHNGVKGEAHIRVIPPLPWQWDFEDGVIPITWVGMRNRHVPVDAELADALESDWFTHQVYVYVAANFALNRGQMVSLSGPQPNPAFISLLRYVDLDGRVNTLAEAKAAFDPALDKLVRAQVLEKFTWGGSDGKLQLELVKGPRKMNGKGAILKVDRIPRPRDYTQLGAKSRGWLGPVDLHDYTIQADFKATAVNNRLADMGLIAQGYTFKILAANKKLQITSWDAQERPDAKIDFTVSPNVWYTMKFSAANEGETAVLRGKIWKRGEQEPADWTLTCVDKAPNRTGSPGFMGNTNFGQFMIDNVSVTPNGSK